MQKITPPPLPFPLTPAQSGWLLATAAATLAPHFAHLPIWLGLACAGLLAARFFLLRQAQARVPNWLILALAVLLCGAIALSFGRFFGREPGVAVLAVLLCLKLLEARRRRDAYAAIYLSFFLQLGLFFQTQSLLIAALAIAGTLVSVAALHALYDEMADRGASPTHRPEGVALPSALVSADPRFLQLLRLLPRLKRAGLLVAQGLPFMLLLFFLFPRIPGPLWGLPADAHSGRTGLSDTMSPGDIAQLIPSDAIALRAEFDGPVPPPHQRYWRGPVLTRFDGRTWHASDSMPLPSPSYTVSGPEYRYQLTIEAHNQRWLLALDYPGAGLDAVYGRDFQLLATRPIRQRQRIELASYPQSTVGREDRGFVLTQALQLPDQGNPRARALAAELTAELAADTEHTEQIIARALAVFRRSELVYTLYPPLLGDHPIDEFLFDTRRGFCEHFASAFTFLMRAAGIPARVVTGYHGGDINPIDQQFVVRQSDAHAWTEVWIEGRGWQRIDPTAAHVPDRTELGLAAALPGGEALPLFYRPEFEWLRDLRHRWDALNNGWNQWVLGYNRERQQQLLNALGLRDADWRKMLLPLFAATAVLLGLLVAWAYRRREAGDELDRAWGRFTRRLARHGVVRPAWEGPLAFAERAASALPQHAPLLRKLSRRYARLRYGPPAPAAARKEIIDQLRTFRP